MKTNLSKYEIIGSIYLAPCIIATNAPPDECDLLRMWDCLESEDEHIGQSKVGLSADGTLDQTTSKTALCFDLIQQHCLLFKKIHLTCIYIYENMSNTIWRKHIIYSTHIIRLTLVRMILTTEETKEGCPNE